MVEAQKIQEKKKSLYLCCLLQTCHSSQIKASFITGKKTYRST